MSEQPKENVGNPPRETKLPRNRLLPYRMLVMLLYGHAGAEPAERGKVRVRIGPLARALRTSNNRVKDYLSWLAERGFIESLTFTHGYAMLYVVPPTSNRA